MAVSAFASSEASPGRDMAAINITPLIDVLLVLLVIFMVAAPVLTHDLDLNLPRPNPDTTKPPPRMQLSVQADGSLQLDGEPMTVAALREALATVAHDAPRTVLQISTNADADYQGFARALATARNSGIANIALEP